MHLEAKGKSHFKFLDWILKLVRDLLPYSIVALMFAAFWSLMAALLWVCSLVLWEESQAICILAVLCDVYGLYCTLHP